jgi:hypothetical protein
MQRRLFLASFAAFSITGHAMASSSKVASLDDALHWLDQLEKAVAPRSAGAWPLVSVLDHLAQSIEMSLDGFPEPKGALFQSTVGLAAFAVFKWRGKMTHGLAEVIPGAPPLAQGDWHPTAQRLRKAILRFNGHTGALRPHFAYGALSKADFALAHTLHIANHQDELFMA